MSPTSLLATSFLAISCALLTTSCVLRPESPTEAEPGEVLGSSVATTMTAGVPAGEAQAPPVPAHAPEPIGEAEQEWTRTDCYAAWQHNGNVCNSSPPNLRLGCYAAVAALLTACLAAAQG